jgi:hypothetical protein
MKEGVIFTELHSREFVELKSLEMLKSFCFCFCVCSRVVVKNRKGRMFYELEQPNPRARTIPAASLMSPIVGQ